MTPGAARPIRVGSANAASGRDHRTGAPDLASWSAALAQLRMDVAAVQEVDYLLERSGRVDQTDLIARACAAGGAPWTSRFAAAVHGTPGDPRTFGSARATRTGRPSYGVALLTPHPVLDWWELRMPPSRLSLPVPLPPGAPRRVLWVPDEQRVAVAGRVAVPGGTLTVVCTHLSFVPARALAQLRELRAWAARLPRPLLVLGDLNLPGRWPARITGWTPLVRARTYPAAHPRRQLDHVLLDDPDARVRVVDSAALVLAHSDHRAVTATLVRRPGRGSTDVG